MRSEIGRKSGEKMEFEVGIVEFCMQISKVEEEWGGGGGGEFVVRMFKIP